MLKKAKPKKQRPAAAELPIAAEPFANYLSVKRLPTVDDFTYRRFQKIADKVPFTQKEWAQILHLSERTLQRYAKDNSSFEGIYIDKLLHVQQLIELGLETFTSSDALYNWLKKEKHVLGHPLHFESLFFAQGIQDIIDELGRIQHGIYI